MIKNDRKISVRYKSIIYGDIQEHISYYNKPMNVNRDYDEILEDIKKNIFPFDIEIVDEVEIKKAGQVIKTETKEVMGNYLFDNLKPTTKKYLRDNDKKFSIFEYLHFDKRVNKFDIYDIREKRMLKLYPTLENDDNQLFNLIYEQYVVCGGTLPTPTDNKAYTSARRSYKMVKALALANCSQLTKFCTFTFASELNKDKHLRKNNERLQGEKNILFRYIENDYDIKVKAYTTFMNELKKKLKKNYDIDLKYITVPEEHGNGDIHFHSVISELPDELTYDNPYWLDYDSRTKRRYNGKGLTFWRCGKSDIQTVKDKEKISTYIAKYMLKNFSQISKEDYQKYLNKKKYYASLNLIKPTQKYLISEKEIDDAMFKVLADTYREEYKNPYNDSIINKYIIPLS
jgi:hypothetical protein